MEITDIISWSCFIVYCLGAIATTWWCENRLQLHGKINREERVFIIITGIFWIVSLPFLGIQKMTKKKL